MKARVLIPVVSALALTSCGGDDSYSPTTPGRDVPEVVVPAPTPSPTPTATATPTPTGGVSGANGYSAADFNSGTAYPAAATVTVGDTTVPAGASVVNVPVTLDHKTPNTIIAKVRVMNGSGGRAAPDTTKAVIFRPGDPLSKTVAFNVASMSQGNTVRSTQPEVPSGGNRSEGAATITAAAGTTTASAGIAAAASGRAAMQFAPVGQLVYSETGATIKFDDKGGPDTFSTALSHGRTQPGNNETGYYGTVAMGGFTRSGDTLTINSWRPAEAVIDNRTSFPFISSMLSGHKTTSAQFVYGTVEWDVKMPNRSGSWPALWLIAVSGWPPEIDVYEGFGYDKSWKFAADLSTNLHGGTGGVRTFTRSAATMTMQDFGLNPTLDSEFHKFAVTVTPEWITMFVDGVETMQYANPFAGKAWYPLTNVAVKADPADPYNTGKGTMEIRSIKVWRQ